LFWEHKRELKILEWVNRDHNESDSAKKYEALCSVPLLPPQEEDEAA
jgi:hypothetical protein